MRERYLYRQVRFLTEMVTVYRLLIYEQMEALERYRGAARRDQQDLSDFELSTSLLSDSSEPEQA